MRERVGVMVYGIWVEGKSGKGPYGREGWSRDIQYMGGGKIRERVIWERGLGKSGKGPYGREGWGDDILYSI